MLAITGQRSESLRRRMQAKSLLDVLVAGDPQNRTWLRASLYLRLKEAELVRTDGNPVAAAKLVDDTREQLEKLALADPKDPELTGRLATACRLQAELRAGTGGPGAAEAAARAVELAERLVGEASANDAYVGEFAQTRVTAGRIAAQNGEPDVALRHWRRALELIEARLPGSNHWRILVPAAHVLWLLGQRDASRAVVERLQRLGFQPLQPWPEGAAPSSLSGSVNPE